VELCFIATDTLRCKGWEALHVWNEQHQYRNKLKHSSDLTAEGTSKQKVLHELSLIPQTGTIYQFAIDFKAGVPLGTEPMCENLVLKIGCVVWEIGRLRTA
jgi:hypothetical protein